MWTTFGGTRSDLRKRDSRGSVPPAYPLGGTPSGGRSGVRPGVTLRPMLRTWLAKEVIAMSPIHIPREWDDNDVLYFEEFCTFVRTPQRTARDWKRRGIGPRWWRINGNGRLYTTVAELRRFLAAGRRREFGDE